MSFLRVQRHINNKMRCRACDIILTEEEIAADEALCFTCIDGSEEYIYDDSFYEEE